MVQFMNEEWLDAETVCSTLGMHYGISQNTPRRALRLLLRAYADYHTPQLGRVQRRRVITDYLEFCKTGTLPYYALRMCTLVRAQS